MRQEDAVGVGAVDVGAVVVVDAEAGAVVVDDPEKSGARCQEFDGKEFY